MEVRVLLTAIVLMAILVASAMPVSCANELEGKRVLMVIAPDGYKEEELSVPRDIFIEHGAEVDVASTHRGIARGMSGHEMKVNLSLDDVDISDYDAIVIAGGVGSKQYLWNDPRLIALVRDAYAANRTVAAICLSPVVLARAGILTDKECTAYPAARDEMIKNGCRYTGGDVVVSGNIVTAKGPECATEFAIEISNVMTGPGASPVSTQEPETEGYCAPAVLVAFSVVVLLNWRRGNGRK